MKPTTITLLLVLCCAGAPVWLTVAGAQDVSVEAGQEPSERGERLKRLAQGAMAKFRVAEDRPALADISVPSPDGGERRLADWRGKTLLLHFWASWCAPCQTEIPQIARLAGRFDKSRFEVMTVSLDRSAADAERFLKSLGVAGLPLASDPEGRLTAARLGARGLPTSILIDPDGREIGRLEGSADWQSDDAILLIMALLGEGLTKPPG